MDEEARVQLNLLKPTESTNKYKKHRAEQELQQAVQEGQQVLATATTVVPFTLFPDTITVDREKITITRRMFFRAAEVVTVRVEDVLNITADVGPFFGSLKITTRFFDSSKPYAVNFLQRKDTFRLKRIIAGYIIAIQKQIDCSALDADALAGLLDELGRADPVSDV